MAIKFVLASDCRDFIWYCKKFGMAMAAKIPMIATTIINSMRVNPSCFLSTLLIIPPPG
jgi:hypothetical protein